MLSRYPGFAQTTSLAPLRQRARKLLIELGRTSCECCGYDKHFEAAHIKPIGSFPLDTPISDINSLENLVSLCPNCHWEFDNK